MAEAGHPQAAEIARKEINLLLGLVEQAGVDDARLRHDLHLSENDWEQWLGVLRDAPLPAAVGIRLTRPTPYADSPARRFHSGRIGERQW